MITLKSATELKYMRDAGKVVAGAHQEVKKSIKPGVTTAELDRLAENFILAEGASAAFKGLYDFPAATCISVNEQVVHGIPDKKTVLAEGDIVSVDIGAGIHGYFGDSAKTFPVGEIDSEAARLLRVTEESLFKGIEQAQTGKRLSDISHAVQKHAEAAGFSVVRDYVGHGVGSKMHEDPQIPNFGRPGHGPRLRAGMTLAIEPMINMGTYEVKTLLNNWTVVTKDGKLSAHFEHTVAITDDQPEILTKL
ncbi:MAG: type I methionyl aminopeptidase [Clostridia bacterium]|nr:type I methionyl aminopeptidase [Clostridia bacterium]